MALTQQYVWVEPWEVKLVAALSSSFSLKPFYFIFFNFTAVTVPKDFIPLSLKPHWGYVFID